MIEPFHGALKRRIVPNAIARASINLLDTLRRILYYSVGHGTPGHHLFPFSRDRAVHQAMGGLYWSPGFE